MLKITEASTARLQFVTPEGEGIEITFSLPFNEPLRSRILSLLATLDIAGAQWQKRNLPKSATAASESLTFWRKDENQ